MRNRGRFAGIVFVAASVMLGFVPAARAAEVFIDLNSATQVFTPSVVTINVGDTVTWRYTQGGGLAHNVASDPYVVPAFRSGDPAQGGGAPWPFSVVFTTPGTIRYYCEPHGDPNGSGMSGIIYVGRSGNEQSYTIGAWDLQPLDDSTGWAESLADEGSRVLDAGTRELRANLNIPSGSQIVGLELVGCDRSDTFNMSATLRECPDADGTCDDFATVGSSGDSNTPGCGAFASAAVSKTVNNVNFTYVVNVFMGSSLNHLRRVKVIYKRQVSPGPATATFGDVPTNHAFFPFIEALVKAGITSGCGAGIYCPDSAVTRGQMAVFLSRAFGFNWPN